MSAPTLLLAPALPGPASRHAVDAILGGLGRLGLAVADFAVGLRPAMPGGLTLDSWAMRLETLAALLDRAGDGADMVLGHGRQALFDGAEDGSGCIADLAALFGLPVILHADATLLGHSVVALVDGHLRHREDVQVAAVVLTGVADAAQARHLVAACDACFSAPVLGCIAADAVPALDLARLPRLARHPGVTPLQSVARPLPPPGQRIAVAAGPGFEAALKPVLDGWRVQGAELRPFSPAAGDPVPADADAVYLPPGELAAPVLGGRLRAGLAAAAGRGAFVYGEGSGHLLLGRSLTVADRPHEAAGLLPMHATLTAPLPRPVYRQAALLAACPLGGAGAAFRGHVPNPATIEDGGVPPLFDLGPHGFCGSRLSNVAGSPVQLVDRARPA